MSIEQALRESHCARDGDHPCVGEVTITREGLKLSCKLCGTDEPLGARAPRHIVELAQRMATAIGLDLDCLSSEALQRLYLALRSDVCPSCSSPRELDASSWHCRCGAFWWYSEGGWSRVRHKGEGP